jgi:hypothetical protein
MAPKECTLCHTPRGVLVRCQIDESGKWNFVCPGKCWHSVSGGVEDARGFEGQYPHYRYGGMVSIIPISEPGGMEIQASPISFEFRALSETYSWDP